MQIHASSKEATIIHTLMHNVDTEIHVWEQARHIFQARDDINRVLWADQNIAMLKVMQESCKFNWMPFCREHGEEEEEHSHLSIVPTEEEVSNAILLLSNALVKSQ